MIKRDSADSADSAFLDSEKFAGIKPRTCTDFPCLLIFFAFLGGMSYVLNEAFLSGDIRRLSHGFNYKGQLCGVDKGAEDRPMLYYCPDPKAPFVPGIIPKIPSKLDLMHPICVSSCPTSDQQMYNCYAGSSVVETPTLMPNQDYTVSIKYDFKSIGGYPTYPFMHRYCVPQSKELATKMLETVQSGCISQIMSKVGSIRSGYPAIILAGGLAILLGYSYLLTLRCFAKVLVYSCLFALIFGSLGAGAYLTKVGFEGGVSKGCGDSTFDKIIGISLLVCGVVFALLTWCKKRSIRMAVGCVQAACQCMFAMPSLLLQPMLELIFKISILIFLTWGFLWVMSTGDVKRDTAMVGGQKVGGLSRTISWTEEQKYMMAYWGFGMIWINCIFNALGQFVVSYSVVLWYFTPNNHDGSKDSPNFPLCRGAFNGIFYHFGTLVFGGLLIAICTVIRIVLSYVAKQSQAAGNALMATIAKALMCLVTCFQRFLEFVNKNAYMDVAINSTSFCSAAKNAFGIITSELSTIALLNGACFIFQLAGGLVISGGGAFLTYVIVTTQPQFTSNESAWYVADPVFLCVAAGFVCLAIAWAFMVIFDQTADTLLYCFITDKNNPKRSKSGHRIEFAPSVLADLISESK